jgi:hypothetical protein
VQLDNGDVHWFCPHHAAMASGRVDLGWHSAPCCHTRSGAGTSAELVAARLWPVGAIPTPNPAAAQLCNVAAVDGRRVRRICGEGESRPRSTSVWGSPAYTRGVANRSRRVTHALAGGRVGGWLRAEVPPFKFDRAKYVPTRRHPGPSAAELEKATLARQSREARAMAAEVENSKKAKCEQAGLTCLHATASRPAVTLPSRAIRAPFALINLGWRHIVL